ncbi:MAG TPA: bifunctional phosphopantothenoylcysteine decarboxylase/phosphopantothenate--cysteine ligase CoaBC [Kineosporiaceae bacterium]|nr:bifunctional phosphopantothenoylcysteine decarboxylase/phosphopantothenate--cysteine ligase CoaBC [Kineosporiaceae bacterium]
MTPTTGDSTDTAGTTAGPRRPRVVLGVSGGIAAYKACLLLRLLTESGHDVTVVPTAAALEFVGAPTWAALSGHPVSATVWEGAESVPHVRLGREAELVVVAPATADLLARAAHGLADDLLTSTLLTARCPVLLAPAMHTEMWLHPATRANVATLRERGVVVLDPASGRLTGADTGPGRLPEPEAILTAALALLRRGAAEPDLAGRRVVVSAGGTREPLDPVRYLGNRSSGRQGFALAATAAARGAAVTLVAANSELAPPAGVDVVHVGTAEELRRAVHAAVRSARTDAVVMAAAVADFRPAKVSEAKIKKTDDPREVPQLELERTTDVLAELVTARTPGQVVVGFAAETGDDAGDVLAHARAKLARKGSDLLVVNDVSGGGVFGRSRNAVTVLDARGGVRVVPEGTKEEVADAVWDAVAELWTAGHATPDAPVE